jgi:hypothetical protein
MTFGTVCTVISWFLCVGEVKLLQSLFNLKISVFFKPVYVSDNNIYKKIKYMNVTLPEFQSIWKVKLVIF